MRVGVYVIYIGAWLLGWACFALPALLLAAFGLAYLIGDAAWWLAFYVFAPLTMVGAVVMGIRYAHRQEI
jgi:hypothetical protein